ncbi:alpha-glucosidase C-terminal domain-containing protein [Rhizobium leguminosarum]|uniref:alpha-glucosidase C-terminal domain-containing protein n=1 Tax=Rhizobium leguminosarum TaxID=384 RepID=UPI0028F42E6B|nr:alpha-glucosidase C-terminal domain-containing protein [Rhizobium leguminosarum]
MYGEYRSWLDQHPDVFVYTRTFDRTRMIVVANFTSRHIALSLPSELGMNGECLICNYEPVNMINETIELSPYEAFAIASRTG